MKGLMKWISNTKGVKRWMLLGLVGVILITYGIANIIVKKAITKTDLINISICFVLGVLALVISSIQKQKRMLEILVEESDTRYEKNNLNSLIFNKKVYHQGPKVVVIGGGSGLNTVVRGLKNYTDNITAIVTLSDYGEIRSDSNKELKMLPINDIKEGIIALANDEEAMEALLAHRFRNPKLRGLNFGDIYIAGMTEVNGSFNSSIESAGNILNMTGKVIPVTLDPIKICAELEDGSVVEDRSIIPEEVSRNGKKIQRVYITPTNTRPAPGVIEAIMEADAIVIGPGSLYTNVIPNLLIKGIAKSIKESKATKIYVSNIMTEMGQTDEYTLSDHVKAIIDYVGKGIIDYCIYDTGEIVPEFIQLYNLKGSDIVLADVQNVKELGVSLIQRNLSKIEGDLIRHDPDIIASTIIQLICDELVFDDMENDSQFITLNNKLKETEKERKKREKEELKFMTSGKSIFERSALMSKFKLKYQERMETIRKGEDEIKENNHTNDE